MENCPIGYKELISKYNYYSHELIIIALNFIERKSYIIERDAYFNLETSSSCLLEDISVLLEYENNFPDYFQLSNLDRLNISIQKWSKSGLYSGQWESINSFVKKKSVIIEDTVFLVINSQSNFDQILYHPFLNYRYIDEEL